MLVFVASDLGDLKHELLDGDPARTWGSCRTGLACRVRAAGEDGHGADGHRQSGASERENESQYHAISRSTHA